MPTAPKSYPWQRYFCPFDETYRQTGDGFLVAPDASFPWRVNEHLRTIDSLADEPCLVILGEPGMGKSHVMGAMANLVGEESVVIQEQFASFSSGSELRSELFEQPEFDAWRSGSGLLYLFLDALDEAHARIDVLMGGLVRNLQSQPCDRLRLRLSCRSANWPADYAAPLAACWYQESPEIHRLANLSQNDVQLAAEAHAIAPTDLMRQLVASEVTPFAAIPITL